MSVDPLSAISLRLELYFDAVLLSTATGFFYCRNGNYYLITNWHVLSGRSNLTGQPIDSRTGATPNRVVVTLHGSDLNRVFPNQELTINTESESRWLQHRKYGQDVDIGVIPIDMNTVGNGIKIYAYGDIIQDSEIMFSAGHDVFVIGFPRGLGLADVFPIWKRGSIATDPIFGVGEFPGFLIDTATREGMSGSPVYRRNWNMAQYENGATSMGPGFFTRLLGVYSGRYGANDEFLAQIGRVWGIKLADEIIDYPSVGTYEIRN